MKYYYFGGGSLKGSFCFIPSISYNWEYIYQKYFENLVYIWEINFVWMFWYFSIGNTKNNLKKISY